MSTIFTPKSQTTRMLSYNAAKRVLEIEFTGGRTYHYFDVPAAVWDNYKEEIESGGSSGAFVNQKIKPAFRFREVKHRKEPKSPKKKFK